MHGLDQCPDHGIDGFKRYVALAVMARNIHRIGAILKQQPLLPGGKSWLEGCVDVASAV